MEGIIAIVIGLGLLVAIIVWAVKYTKKINKRKERFYSEFAQKHGLQHSSSKYMMAMLNVVQGTYKGSPFTVFEKMEGSGKNKSVVTRASFENVPFDYDFKIGKEHIFSKAGKLLGMKDIEFGDEEFDKKFLIKSKDEEKFRAFFNYKLQGALKELKSDLASSIRVSDGTMTYMHYGPLPNEKTFRSFERVVDFMILLIDEASHSRS
ncbi:MAG: hypothetical protein HUJ25_11600 [Crocinitomicaceae bacterium]|nr:hypothetical protein [Crocinitomicaceae bacterium]